MKPTKKQVSRRFRSFHFMYHGEKSWFYLCPDSCSFHQEGVSSQQNVYGLRVQRLIKALVECGYIKEPA